MVKMQKKYSKSRYKRVRLEADRISNLPDAVIDHILTFLPIKDLGKTSLLSRKWRYKWATVPSLVFTDTTLPDSFALRSTIDHILLAHSGLICKFGLSYERPLPHKDIDRWVIHISRHPIKEFTLQMPSSLNYKMLSSLFSCNNLTHLDLHNCSLYPSSAFTGFNGLKSLTLKNVNLKRHTFEALMTSSVLEELCLDNLAGVDQLSINAPNLRRFDFEGPFSMLRLQNTLSLAVFTTYTDPEEERSGNLLELFAEMPKIEMLTYPCSTFESFNLDDIPSALPDPFLNLRYMLISIDFRSLKGSLGLLCLLGSAPNLRELVICCSRDADNETNRNVWVGEEWNGSLTCLRHVRISNYGGIQPEVDFVSFMLLTSHALMKMAVQSARTPGNGPNHDRKKLEMTKQLLMLKRIVFEDS